MSRLSDVSLAAQVAVLGNRRAFDQIVRQYQSPVRRFFLAQTGGDEALSDDLAQDTFLKAYTRIAQYRGLSSLLTWLTRIAYNVWYDHCRSRRQRGEGAAQPLAAVPEVLAATSAPPPGVRADIYGALALLRAEERTCITLQLVEGYQVSEIAEITGMPAGTVKSHLKRGKDRLADYLRKNGYDR